MKLALCILLSLVAVFARADWTPPAHPNASDAEKIYDEAQDDTRAGRYEDALAKFLWFHHNALKLDPSECGVRLSFALYDWNELGKVYPPAAEKLRATRDEAGKDVRENAEYRQAFLDFESINEQLKEDNKTVELFIWLDANKPNVATNIFDLAESVLIGAKEYHLCGKYIEPDSSYHRFLLGFNGNIDSKGDNFLLRWYHRSYLKEEFSYNVATLVALLVLNDRKADADRIATEALKELSNRKFKDRLTKAKNGELPSK
jgi:hypothetical protein